MFKHRWFHIACLIVLVIIAYANSLPAAFVSDDVHSLTEDPTITNISYVFKNPLDLVQPPIYFIIYNVFGPTPAPFRIVNILFHLGAVLLLYAIISRLWNKTLAFMTAALFAVHPILTESVVWISGGHYVRYGFFFLLSFYLYLRSLQDKRWLVGSLIAYVLAIQSSALAFSLPLVLGVLTLIQEKKKPYITLLIPFFVLSAIMAVFLYFQGYAGRVSFLTDTASHYGKLDIYNSSPLFLIPPQFTTYIQLVLLPAVLTFYHSEIFSFFDVGVRTVLSIAFLILIVVSYKKNKYVFFWLCFILLTLLLVLSPIQVASSSIAERYEYLAAAGVLALVGYGIYWVSKKNEMLGWGLLFLFVALLTVRTIVRNNDWHTYESFWTTTLATSPFSYQAHVNVGNMYYQNGDYENAIKEFKKSLTIIADPKIHYNLATVYYSMGNLNAALLEYNAALKLDPQMPEVYQNMAAIFYQENNFPKSEEFTKKALSFSPNNPNIMVNLGLIYLQEGRKADAKAIFQQVLTIDPTSEKAKQGIAASSQ